MGALRTGWSLNPLNSLRALLSLYSLRTCRADGSCWTYFTLSTLNALRTGRTLGTLRTSSTHSTILTNCPRGPGRANSSLRALLAGDANRPSGTYRTSRPCGANDLTGVDIRHAVKNIKPASRLDDVGITQLT